MSLVKQAAINTALNSLLAIGIAMILGCTGLIPEHWALNWISMSLGVALGAGFTCKHASRISKSTVATVAVVFLLFASTAYAGNRYCNTGYCAPVAKVQQVYVPQQIIQNQQVFYSVGAEARYNSTPAIQQAHLAQAQRDLQRATDTFRELQQYSQQQPQTIVLRLEAGTVQQQQQAMPEACGVGQQQPNGPTTFSQTSSVLQGRCFDCHGGKKGIKGDFDLRGALTCDQKFAAVQNVIAEKMPKGGPSLTNEEFGQFIKEIAAIPTVGEQQQPQQPAPPQQPPQTPPQGQPAPDQPAPTPNFSKIDAATLLKLLTQKK